ncbi:MAG: alpha/beta hydrolase [Oscillospiraceae bacterium]|nr:alpha/beta hydrolase [Oscillospiraceae bacterium]
MKDEKQPRFRDVSGDLRRQIIRILLSEMQIAITNKQMELPDQTPSGSYQIEEYLNIPYMNRSEVALGMDIYKPVVPETEELPVIVTLYGGGLVGGNRKSSRPYARELASRGYLVFAIEYRLVPRANCAEQLDDVCAGMDLVGQKLVDFNVDFSRVFLTGSSAGGYLSLYVAAMKNSEKLQKAIGFPASRIVFRAVGLDCGMLYTCLSDPIGLILSEQFYGEKRDDPAFLQYMDPEILDNLPPIFLNTSRGDFLNNYSLMFHKALKDAGKPVKLVYYGEQEAGRAFVANDPSLPQSRDAITRMLQWFEEQADIQRKQAAASKKKTARKPRKTS